MEDQPKYETLADMQRLTKEPQCTLTDEELLKRCDEWIDKLCKSGGHAWCLRVPVNFNRDPDMLFVELMKRYQATLNP